MNLFVSDASDSAAFVYRADGSFDFVQEFIFEPDQRILGSGLRELLAVRFALRFNSNYFRQFGSQYVFWQTDSQNCYGFLIRGSKKPAFEAVVREIRYLERQLAIQIIPVWTPRSHERIVIADLGSK